MRRVYACAMTSRKSIKKFMAEPAEMRIYEFVRVMEYFGFRHARTKGSHYIFDNSKNAIIVIPVHNNKVTKHYLKYAKSVIIKS